MSTLGLQSHRLACLRYEVILLVHMIMRTTAAAPDRPLTKHQQQGVGHSAVTWDNVRICAGVKNYMVLHETETACTFRLQKRELVGSVTYYWRHVLQCSWYVSAKIYLTDGSSTQHRWSTSGVSPYSS